MNLNVRFVGRSLLYGYSCMWVITQIVFPSVGWPKFRDTRNHFVLLDISRVRLFMKTLKESCLDSEYFNQAFSIIRWIEVLLYVSYLAAVVFINLEVQKSILKEFGIDHESELAYKAIYYAPLLHVSVWPINSLKLFA